MVAALICLAVMAASCRPAKEIVTETKIEYVHDTTLQVTHDTVKVVERSVDSVDRFVEKIVYVDSNGVWHEKEIEKLTRYIYEENAYYESKIKQYESKIEKLEEQLSEKTKIEYVEKKLNWYQKTMMVLGWCFVGTLIVLGVCLFIKLKRKVK